MERNSTLIGKDESVVLSHGDCIRIREHYAIQKLGGTFAEVYVAIHRKTKTQLAVKIVERAESGDPGNSGGATEKEGVMLQSMEHANIVPIVGMVKTTQFSYIFMPMFLGGDLCEYLTAHGPLTEIEAKFVAYQVLQALK
ncbi:Meiosis-specific serine/threonine-protein kinase mek1, partial [Lunasporangiospora selenospora]